MGPGPALTGDNWAHGLWIYLLTFGMTKEPQNISVKHLKHLSFGMVGMVPGYLYPRSSKIPAQVSKYLLTRCLEAQGLGYFCWWRLLIYGEPFRKGHTKHGFWMRRKYSKLNHSGVSLVAGPGNLAFRRRFNHFWKKKETCYPFKESTYPHHLECW